MVNKKIMVNGRLLILILFIFLFSFIVNSLEMYDLDGTTVENITFTGDENITRYLNISKYANVLSAYLNLSGFISHYNVSEYSDMFYAGGDGLYSVNGIYTNVSDFWVIGLGNEGNGTIARYDSNFDIIGSSKSTNVTYEDITGNGTDLWLIDTVSVSGNATGVVDRYDVDGNYLDGFMVDTTEFIDAMKAVDSSWENTYYFNGITYNGSVLWIMASVYKYLLEFDSVMCAYSTEGVSLNHCITELDNLCFYDVDYNSGYFWCGANFSGKTITKLNPDGTYSDSFVVPYNFEGIAMNGSGVFTSHDRIDHEIFEYDTAGSSLINYSTLNISNSVTIDGMLATNGTSIWTVYKRGAVQEYDYDGNYIGNPKNFTLSHVSQNYGSLDWDGTYFWRYDRYNKSFFQYDSGWNQINNWADEGYLFTGITSNGTHLFGVYGYEYVLVYNFTGVTWESYFKLGDSSFDLFGIDYDEYEDCFWIYNASTIFKYNSDFTDTGITYEIPSYQQTITTLEDIAVSEKGLLVSTSTNVYKHSFTYPKDPWLEIGTPDGTREWIHSNEFNITNNKTSDLSSSINSALNSGLCDCDGCTLSGDYCLVPFLFHSDTIGRLQYSDINIIYTALTITSETYSPANIYNNVSAIINATIIPKEGGIDTVWIRANYTGDYVNYSNATVNSFTNDGYVWSYFIDNGNFTNQDNISWQFIANDTNGEEVIGAMQSFIVKNRNATIPSGEVAITPDPPSDTDDLNCTVGDRYDYDGEAVNFYFHWYLNGVIQSIDVNSQNLSSGNTTNNENWQCGAIPYDIWGNGTEVKSQVVIIGSANVGPVISQTNVTTINTTIISSSTNPTNNNSGITFYVGYTDDVDVLDDGFSAYFCKSDDFTFPETCDGGEWAKNQSNITETVLSADFTITSSETQSSYPYYAFVTDNETVSASLSGTFHVNHPPDNDSLVYPISDQKVNTKSVILNATVLDSDLDTITYYFYVNQSIDFELNGTSTTGELNFSDYADTTNYTWFAERIDEHGYTAGNTSKETFSVDYTIPNNIITAKDYTDTSDGQSAIITMSQSDNTALDSCYWYILLYGNPSSYTKTPCNTEIKLDSTNLTIASSTYTVRVKTNDTYGNENITDVTFTTTKYVAPVTPPAPPSGGGGGGITCPEGELWDASLGKCVPKIVLPINVTNLTLSPTILVRPSIALPLITQFNTTFKQDFKSNFRLTSADVIAGDFNVTVIANTTVQLSYPLDKRENWLTKIIEGSFSVTDLYGRTFFVSDIKVTIYNPGYLVFGFIPVWAFAPILLMVIIVAYIKRRFVFEEIKSLFVGVKNAYSSIVRRRI